VDERTLQVLEYDKIREIVASYALSDPGREMAASLRPLADRGLILRQLQETSELKEVIESQVGFVWRSFKEVLSYLLKAQPEGSLLQPAELLAIADVISLSQAILRFFKKREEIFPALQKIIGPLSPLEDLRALIEQCLDSTGEVKDSASRELGSIRKRVRLMKERLSEKLKSLIGSPEIQKLLADNIITFRQDRYVIPIKAGSQHLLKGIVHDHSSSGATVFVEPMVTVEMNNSLGELVTEEKREVERILKKVTSRVRENFDPLRENSEILARLDLIYAKARFSLEYGAVEPLMETEAPLRLVEASHPLLLKGTKELGKQEVVPLTIELGERFRTLVITGPNTGGKTVALKTVGLASLMAQSGMHIPAKEGTRLPVFEKVFADVGDEQSIEASLSTFSSHVRQISKALSEAARDSLILLDEIGVGTDPEEGAALAEAVVEYLTSSGALTIVTTHYGALKTLATRIPGVENGSMEFDSENFKPTFRFVSGIPGSSYALEVASNLGMSKEVLDRAWSLVGGEHRDLSKLLVELRASLRELSAEKKELSGSREAIEELQKLYQDRLQKVRAAEKELKGKTLKESREVVETTRRQMEQLLREIQKTQAEKKSVKRSRQALEEKRRELEEKLQEFDQKLPEKVGRFVPGERVEIKSLKIPGEVISEPDAKGHIRVRTANMVVTVPVGDVAKRTSPEVESRYSGKSSYDAPERVGIELDLRGMTFEEAQPVLDRFLDEALLVGVEQAYIIHGKGTGALREKVKKYLSRCPQVESHRLGAWNEGGDGVTIVILKK
jgi:DNA mismatch repair protein MutS2